MSTSVKALSVLFVIIGAFLLGYAVTMGVLIEFTTSRVVLCSTSTACIVLNALNIIND